MKSTKKIMRAAMAALCVVSVTSAEARELASAAGNYAAEVREVVRNLGGTGVLIGLASIQLGWKPETGKRLAQAGAGALITAISLPTIVRFLEGVLR